MEARTRRESLPAFARYLPAPRLIALAQRFFRFSSEAGEGVDAWTGQQFTRTVGVPWRLAQSLGVPTVRAGAGGATLFCPCPQRPAGRRQELSWREVFLSSSFFACAFSHLTFPSM